MKRFGRILRPVVPTERSDEGPHRLAFLQKDEIPHFIRNDKSMAIVTAPHLVTQLHRSPSAISR
jgi:hypothetical protein